MCLSALEIIAAAKDVVLALAAIATVIVAFKGLNTWRRQLHGAAHFEAARGLAKAAYKVREKLQASRSPLLSAHEFPPEHHDSAARRSPEQEAKGYAYVYSNRWAPVGEAMQEFDASVLEADVLWGKPVRDTSDRLRQVVREVNVAVDALIANAASRGEDFSSDKEFGKRMRSTVSALPTDSKNEINGKLAASTQTLDELIRPHLQRS